jgi:DNA-binding HxlR family transcriptional regulator
MNYRHRYKDILDYTIIDILDTKYPSCLRYYELEREISLHCKISSSTLARHLARLVGRKALDRQEEKKYGHTFYSLTKEFKDSLHIQKKYYPKNYFEKTLSLNNYRITDYGFDFDKNRDNVFREQVVEYVQSIKRILPPELFYI